MPQVFFQLSLFMINIMLRIVAPNGVKVGCRLGRCGMLFAHARHCDVKSFSTNKSVRLGPSKRKEVLCCLLVV